MPSFRFAGSGRTSGCASTESSLLKARCPVQPEPQRFSQTLDHRTQGRRFAGPGLSEGVSIWNTTGTRPDRPKTPSLLREPVRLTRTAFHFRRRVEQLIRRFHSLDPKMLRHLEGWAEGWTRFHDAEACGRVADYLQRLLLDLERRAHIESPGRFHAALLNSLKQGKGTPSFQGRSGGSPGGLGSSCAGRWKKRRRAPSSALKPWGKALLPSQRIRVRSQRIHKLHWVPSSTLRSS